MVHTRASAKKIESGQVHGNDGVLPQGTAVGSPAGPDGVPSPAKKRRRDGAKRRRGEPRELCQLNLDVLFLIAPCVHPIDLLNLARTCKSLRQLLMDKCSAFVWKAARAVGGLPDCPADLTEPEYANLVFCARCHGCGKYAQMILWRIRRRYCPNCRAERLLPLSSCHEIIRTYNIPAAETLTIGDQTTYWVDKEQVDSFMHEYTHCFDQKQFLRDKQRQNYAVREHAYECISWQSQIKSDRRFNLRMRRQERESSIFERLRQHGYEPEVAYFDSREIKETHKSFFTTFKPLTDKEWARMWPEWLVTMNKLRFKRLDRTVYRPRRDSLASEYASYVTSPSPDTPAFDLLPHVADLVQFPPFQDIIRAPHGTQENDKPFESAFAQLPVLVDVWRKKLDAQLAELVKIPSHLSLKNASRCRAAASSQKKRMESSQTAIDKLHLASAVFFTNDVYTYPEILSTVHYIGEPDSDEDDSERAVSIENRFRVEFLEDAPYIVHACGLDPNVATVEDMDRRNARLKCLTCKDERTKSWRDAMRHAFRTHPSELYRNTNSISTRWEIISDKYIDEIQAAELSVKKDVSPPYTRCLLCRPCVGDALYHVTIGGHLQSHHGVASDDIKVGVHYVNLGIGELRSVGIVEKEGQVTFSEPVYHVHPR